MNSDYTENIHKTGRVWFILAFMFMFAFPIVTCIYFNSWPTVKEFFGAAIGVIPIYWTVGVVEFFTYCPMLGAGGSYLGFVTGNMSNLKVPVALNAVDAAGLKQGTEDADLFATIAIAVSSLVTLLVIVVFVILMVPLTPVFSNEALAPAFSNVVPALFGGLMVAFISKCKLVGIPIVLLAAILFIFIPSLASIYPLILPVLAILALGWARFLFKKEII